MSEQKKNSIFNVSVNNSDILLKKFIIELDRIIKNELGDDKKKKARCSKFFNTILNGEEMTPKIDLGCFYNQLDRCKKVLQSDINPFNVINELKKNVGIDKISYGEFEYPDNINWIKDPNCSDSIMDGVINFKLEVYLDNIDIIRHKFYLDFVFTVSQLFLKNDDIFYAISNKNDISCTAYGFQPDDNKLGEYIEVIDENSKCSDVVTKLRKIIMDRFLDNLPYEQAVYKFENNTDFTDIMDNLSDIFDESINMMNNSDNENNDDDNDDIRNILEDRINKSSMYKLLKNTISDSQIVLTTILHGLDVVLQKDMVLDENYSKVENYLKFIKLIHIYMKKVINGIDTELLDISTNGSNKAMKKFNYQLVRLINVFNSKLSPFNIVSEASKSLNRTENHITSVEFYESPIQCPTDIKWLDNADDINNPNEIKTDKRTNGMVSFGQMFQLDIISSRHNEPIFIQCAYNIDFMVSPEIDIENDMITGTYSFYITVSESDEERIEIYDMIENTYMECIEKLKKIIISILNNTIS